MKYLFVCATLISSTLVQPALAATNPNFWVAFESGHNFTVHTTQKNTLAMPDVNLPDDYLVNNNQNNWMAGVGVGYQFTRDNPTLASKWLPADRIGIFYDYYSKAKLTGVINEWQSITAYHDQFQVHSNTLWLDNQLDLIHLQEVTPFIDLSIGASRNSSAGYSETPVAANNSPRASSAAFGSSNNLALAYRVGFGVNYALPTKHPMTLGMLYRYTDLGRAKLSGSANYPIGGISSHLKSSGVSVALHYYF